MKFITWNESRHFFFCWVRQTFLRESLVSDSIQKRSLRKVHSSFIFQTTPNRIPLHRRLVKEWWIRKAWCKAYFHDFLFISQFQSLFFPGQILLPSQNSMKWNSFSLRSIQRWIRSQQLGSRPIMYWSVQSSLVEYRSFFRSRTSRARRKKTLITQFFFPVVDLLYHFLFCGEKVKPHVTHILSSYGVP
jgi:hypothetical protein